MVNDVRPVDANELLKQSIYCKGEDGSMLYAVPISCIFAAPTLKLLHSVGHWEVGGIDPVTNVVGNWKCDSCHKPSLKDYLYCPHCGAKMERWPEGAEKP